MHLFAFKSTCIEILNFKIFAFHKFLRQIA